MREREQIHAIVDSLPEYKIHGLLTFMLGVSLGERLEDNAYCLSLYQEYLTEKQESDAGTITLEEAMEQWGITQEELQSESRKEKQMPEITRFYGIVIKMYFKPKDHEPSHIYALYNDTMGCFDLKTGQITKGDLSKRAKSLVEEWIALHRDELQEMWDTQLVHRLPPLE